MTYPNPNLEPPFLPSLVLAEDLNFPVRITERGRRHLFWHIVNRPHYSGPGIYFQLMGANRVAWYTFADVPSLDPSTHRFSKFGRVPIAVSLEDESGFAGQIFDCISFPPGPRAYFLCDRDKNGLITGAEGGKFRLSLEKLKGLHPEFFRPTGLLTKVMTTIFSVTSLVGNQAGDTGWIARWVGPWDPEGQTQAIELIAERLWYFGNYPAVVLSEDPFLVGAYSAQVDNTILLRLPKELQKDGPRGRAWLIGDQMISCTGFSWEDEPSGDLPLGPKADWFSNECWCILADLLTDDRDQLEKRKATIPGEQWDRCRELGAKRLANGDAVRDGRPWYSRIGVRDQKKYEYYLPGGYLGR